jgi:general secretion pathway protein A
MTSSIFTFFGLRENPFSVGPDPRFMVLHPAVQAAWDDLLYGVRNRKGLILLTGEVGTGKTTLVRSLIEWLRSHKSPSALVVNSHLDSADLLDVILANFSILCSSPHRSDKLTALNRWLTQRYDARQIPVLIVDEAQGLVPRVLEEIRLLLNMETPSEKLLQIVLAGQPELENKLRTAEFYLIRQRIAVRCRTSRLNAEQTRVYVEQRLRLAGGGMGQAIFAPETIEAIHHYSRGIPRVINLLCEHSLINAYADSRRPVHKEAIAEVAREFQCEPLRPGMADRTTSEVTLPSLREERVFAPVAQFDPLLSPPDSGSAGTPDSVVPNSAVPRADLARHKFSTAEALSKQTRTSAPRRAADAPLGAASQSAAQEPLSFKQEAARARSAIFRLCLIGAQALQHAYKASVAACAATARQIWEMRSELRGKTLGTGQPAGARRRIATRVYLLSKQAALGTRMASFAALSWSRQHFPIPAWLHSFGRDWDRMVNDFRRWVARSPKQGSPPPRLPERRGPERRLSEGRSHSSGLRRSAVQK